MKSPSTAVFALLILPGVAKIESPQAFTNTNQGPSA